MEVVKRQPISLEARRLCGRLERQTLQPSITTVERLMLFSQFRILFILHAPDTIRANIRLWFYPTYTRKFPRAYPNPHNTSPNRASALFGPSSLGGVPLSLLSCLFARPVRCYLSAKRRRGALVTVLRIKPRAVLAHSKAVTVPNVPL